MELRGIRKVKVNKKTNLKDKSYEWLLTEKMKLEHSLRPLKCTGARRTDEEREAIMEKISHINSELMSRR